MPTLREQIKELLNVPKDSSFNQKLYVISLSEAMEHYGLSFRAKSLQKGACYPLVLGFVHHLFDRDRERYSYLGFLKYACNPKNIVHIHSLFDDYSEHYPSSLSTDQALILQQRVAPLFYYRAVLDLVFQFHAGSALFDNLDPFWIKVADSAAKAQLAGLELLSDLILSADEELLEHYFTLDHPQSPFLRECPYVVTFKNHCVALMFASKDEVMIFDPNFGCTTLHSTEHQSVAQLIKKVINLYPSLNEEVTNAPSQLFMKIELLSNKNSFYKVEQAKQKLDAAWLESLAMYDRLPTLEVKKNYAFYAIAGLRKERVTDFIKRMVSSGCDLFKNAYYLTQLMYFSVYKRKIELVNLISTLSPQKHLFFKAKEIYSDLEIQFVDLYLKCGGTLIFSKQDCDILAQAFYDRLEKRYNIFLEESEEMPSQQYELSLDGLTELLAETRTIICKLYEQATDRGSPISPEELLKKSLTI